MMMLSPYRRPDFVAVLGILTRTEIEEYAARTKIIREARRARFPESKSPIPPKPGIKPSLTPQVYGETHRDRDRRKDKAGDRESLSISRKARAGGNAKSRWKENLTAAGLGGAAVSLFNVLSEAAEGL
jgi:hypothetical protein